MITKGERTELKSIVRQQFKVLRSELEQREVEMLADIEEQIAAKYASDDRQWSVLQHTVHEAVMACNRSINDALYEAGYQVKGHTERIWVKNPNMQPPREERTNLRIQARRRVKANVHQAQLDLARREADTLRALAIGALESEEAQRFLSEIPTVGDLVPIARLAELEAAFSENGDD